jgi:hypothetical protein
MTRQNGPDPRYNEKRSDTEVLTAAFSEMRRQRRRFGFAVHSGFGASESAAVGGALHGGFAVREKALETTQAEGYPFPFSSRWVSRSSSSVFSQPMHSSVMETP